MFLVVIIVCGVRSGSNGDYSGIRIALVCAVGLFTHSQRVHTFRSWLSVSENRAAVAVVIASCVHVNCLMDAE